MARSLDWSGFAQARYLSPPRKWREDRGAYSAGELHEVERYGDWDHVHAGGPWLLHSYLGGSDYSGTLVERSNRDHWREEFADFEATEENPDGWWIEVAGGHGTFAIVVDTSRATEDAYDTLCALENYPLCDEERHSELERKAQESAWESDVRDDFASALSKATGLDCSEADHALLRELFEDAAERSSTYWENQQADSMYIDVERIAACAVKRCDVAAALQLNTVDSRCAHRLLEVCHA